MYYILLSDVELQEIAKQVISIYASFKVTYGQEENSQISFDDDNKVYQLALVEGYFEPELYLYIHMEIKNGLLWVNWDATEDFLLTQLEEHIPKEQIVLGFLEPEDRQESGYAIGE